jgi:hypothetical protein
MIRAARGAPKERENVAFHATETAMTMHNPDRAAKHAPGSGSGEEVVERLLKPHEKDLGEFSVRRLLPAAKRTMVGPWIFFDHMGPADFPPGQGIKVRPHPHINLATVT